MQEKVINMWLTGKYSLDYIGLMNDLTGTAVGNIITKYLKSLKKNK